jgi:hypothetical protein
VRKTAVASAGLAVYGAVLAVPVSVSAVFLATYPRILLTLQKDLTSLPKILQIASLQHLTSPFKKLIPTIIPTSSLPLSLPSYLLHIFVLLFSKKKQHFLGENLGFLRKILYLCTCIQTQNTESELTFIKNYFLLWKKQL